MPLILFPLLCLAGLALPGVVVAGYVANINDDPAFQLRRQADAAFLAGNHKTALETYRKVMAQSNDLDTIFQMGLMLLRGLGGEANREAGLRQLERAAERGHAAAMRVLAEEAPDENTAKRWQLQAAAAGDARAAAILAQQELAKRFPDRTRARRLARADPYLGELLMGILEAPSEPLESVRRWHRLMQKPGLPETVARRAAWLLADHYYRADLRELAFYWLQLAPSADAISGLPTPLERDIRIDRGTLRSLLEPRQRERIEAAAGEFAQDLVRTMGPDRALRAALNPGNLPCDEFRQAIDVAVAAARVGRSATEIQTDIQNYLPLREASFSAQATRLELAKAVLADFSLLGEIALPELQAMVVGKCRVGGYSTLE